jgi:hypothetical protein
VRNGNRHDRANPRPWVAIARKSGSPLLQLQSRDHLELMCSRLGWTIVAGIVCAMKVN